MTTRWTVPPDLWTGQTVAILGAGPSMSPAIAESMREHRCIALAHTVSLAPWADMLVTLDPSAHRPDFAGIRICGVECDDIDARYVGMLYERVTIAPGHVVQIRNNGMAAIRIAAMAGAARVLLCGFDPCLRGYWTGEWSPAEREYLATLAPSGEVYTGLAAGLAAITDELRARGVEVERVAEVPVVPVVPVTPVKRRRGA